MAIPKECNLIHHTECLCVCLFNGSNIQKSREFRQTLAPLMAMDMNWCSNLLMRSTGARVSMMNSSPQTVWWNCCSVTNGVLIGLVVNEDVSTQHSISAMLCCCIWPCASPWLHWVITEWRQDSGPLLLTTMAWKIQENTRPMVVSHVCSWKRKQILSLPTTRAFLLLGHCQV